MRELNGDLDPEGGTLLATALRLAATEDGTDEPARTPARRRADAMVDIARFFLDHQQHVPAGRHRPAGRTRTTKPPGLVPTLLVA